MRRRDGVGRPSPQRPDLRQIGALQIQQGDGDCIRVGPMPVLAKPTPHFFEMQTFGMALDHGKNARRKRTALAVAHGLLQNRVGDEMALYEGHGLAGLVLWISGGER